MKKIITFCFLILVFTSYSQTFEWLKTMTINFSLNPSIISYPTATDLQDNTYICGFKDNLTSNSDAFGTVFLNKYTSNGELIFTKNITGKAHVYKLTTDNAGNLYAAVSYLTALSVDNLNLSSTIQGEKPILLKFNSNGELQWHKILPENSANHFTTIAVDNDNMVYIGYDNFFISTIEKLNPNGDTLQIISQTGVKVLSAVDVDTEGNIYAVGSCAESNANFNGVSRPAPFDYSTYIVKYSPLGVMQWMHYIEDVTCIDPMLKVGSPDEVYFSSTLFGAFSFGNLTTLGPTNSNPDFFLTRLNANGDFQWVREVPSGGSVDVGHRNYLDLDLNGNIYFAGRTKGTIPWSPTINTQITGFTNDIIILKYTPDGTVAWAKTAGGTADDRADGITVLSDGNLLISGLTKGTAAFDAIQNVSSTLNSYPFLTKLNTTTLELIQQNKVAVAIYPNPTKNSITITTANYRGKVILYNLLGQQLKSFILRENTTNLDLIDIASGSYFLKLENQKIIKVIKE